MLIWIALIEVQRQYALPTHNTQLIYVGIIEASINRFLVLRVGALHYFTERDLMAASLAASFIVTVLAFWHISATARQSQKSTERYEVPISTQTHEPEPNESHRTQACKCVAAAYLLSNRETEVLEQLSKGYSQKKIADTLYLSVGTIQTHMKSIYRKIGLHSRQNVIDLVNQTMKEIGADADKARTRP